MKNKSNIQQSPHFLSFYAPITISIALFATMVYAHGNEDLWNDEIYTRYVSTRYPKSFIQEIQKLPGGWTCTYLQPKPRYLRIVVCLRK